VTNSRLLDPLSGDDWLAVGDAASRFDPLSSQGIVKALRSGIFASYAIGDLLLNGDKSGLRRYQRFVAEEFKSYAQTRLKYYRQEQRWPNSEFWRRRHVIRN
jgi:flavin-dependent dehydrogenase